MCNRINFAMTVNVQLNQQDFKLLEPLLRLFRESGVKVAMVTSEQNLKLCKPKSPGGLADKSRQRLASGGFDYKSLYGRRTPEKAYRQWIKFSWDTNVCWIISPPVLAPFDKDAKRLCKMPTIEIELYASVSFATSPTSCDYLPSTDVIQTLADLSKLVSLDWD
ncbi:MAG: hypothetical protein IPJ82_20770 [Lewinellaceae bacterium]|nr:hypothetical protein [Lewinellaceae bacterium]